MNTDTGFNLIGRSGLNAREMFYTISVTEGGSRFQRTTPARRPVRRPGGGE